MEILGIGPMELVFILIIALIILGPKDMAKAGRTLGKFMRDVVKSDTWKAIRTTTKELEHLPNRMMREAGLEEDLKDLNNLSKSLTADELTKTIKPPSNPQAVISSNPISPEDAAFTQNDQQDQIYPSDTSQPPSTNPN
jgi:sec-independent protein translocase protein TatB